MSNGVAVRQAGGVARLGDASPGLAAAVAHWLAPDPHGGERRRALSAAERGEAAARLAAIEALAAPAGVATVRKWLLIVASGVNNAPGVEDFGPRASAVAMACSDLPGWGFSDATAREALRRFKWFPSAAEVASLIAEATQAERDAAPALRALLAPPDDLPPVNPPMRPEQRAAVAAGLRGLVGEMDARARLAEAEGAARRRARPSPLRPDVLAVVRDASPIVRAARAEGGG